MTSNTVRKSFSLSVLSVEMLKAVGSKYYEKGNKKNLAELQLNIKTATCTAMSHKKGRSELEKWYGKDLQRAHDFMFSIFFEECCADLGNQPIDDVSQRNLLVRRNVLRCLRCPPIFITTSIRVADVLKPVISGVLDRK